MKIQQHDDVVVDAAVISTGLRQAYTEEERCWGGEELRLGCCLQHSPHPSIYRGRGVNLHTLVDRDAEALQERG